VYRSRRATWYAAFAITGTLFVTPLAGLGLARLGVALTPALLIALGLIFGAYGLFVLRNGDIKRGLFVAVLVIATVGANIPLGAIPEGVTVGPNVYLVDLPLLALALITLTTWRREHVTAAQGLLGLYFVWTVFLIALAPNPRPDVTAWYALHVARYALAFALVTRGIVENWLSAGEALGVVIATTVGHAVVASAQVVLGTVNGLTVLGMNTRIVASFPLGPLGSIPSGPYVGGFTGGAPFAVHLTILIPVVLAAMFHDRVPRILALCGAAWFAFLLQLTAWDAARGALLVSLVLVGLVVGWWRTGVLGDRGEWVASTIRESVLTRRWRPLVGVGLVIATVWQIIGPNAGEPHQPTYLPSELGQGVAQSVTIPGFNTQNLAIRIYQYVGGTDTFLQYPLTGLGGANYNYVALSYAPKANMIHNLYIGIFAETGLVGGVVFFGAVGYAVRAVWLTASRNDDPIYLGLLAGLGGMFALQFFQPQYLRATSFVPLWAILGIACGRYRKQWSVEPDRWSRVWDESRIVSGVSSARVLNRLAVLPRSAHAAIESSQVLYSVPVARVRVMEAVASSAIGEWWRTTVGPSLLNTGWRRLRSVCADSWLFG
jgi:hypothetical protein